MPTDHAILSPSGASRWLACTPSARLEAEFPDSTSDAAKEGTLAHAIGEFYLKSKNGVDLDAFDAPFESLKANLFYSSELDVYAQDYANFVIEQFNAAKAHTPDAELRIEEQLDLTKYVPEGFGTGDAVIIADDVLHIIDLKYGKGVPVSCDNNKQMMLYALGALEAFGFLYGVSTVRMTIYQPRLDNISAFEMPVEELESWGKEELMPKAKLAFDGEGEFVAGDHCRFCRAKAQCRALAEKNLELAKYDFKQSPLLTDAEIADILTRSDQFTKWISAIQDYALTEAVENGKDWPGWKLVEGRSVRVYSDQDAIADTLREAGYEDAIIYEKKLLGITAMEKAIGKKNLVALCDSLIVKPQGKPTLAPVADKRPEWNSAAKDFEPINN
jgi:Protein of unknown function (DUF2800).